MTKKTFSTHWSSGFFSMLPGSQNTFRIFFCTALGGSSRSILESSSDELIFSCNAEKRGKAHGGTLACVRSEQAQDEGNPTPLRSCRAAVSYPSQARDHLVHEVGADLVANLWQVPEDGRMQA